MSYTTKYKTRDPLETVNIIKNFFQKYDIEIEENDPVCSISGTWSICLHAYYKGKGVGMSNGKGITKEYAYASGYAELYERFCNKIGFYANHHLTVLAEKWSYENNGYIFHPKEKVYSFSEGLKQSPQANFVLTTSKTEKILSSILHNKWIGVPFYHLNNKNDCKYLDPRILYVLGASSAMCAGNSFHEAVLQGLSEQFEHQVRWNFVELIEKYPIYRIDIDGIVNPELQNIIKNIQIENDFYLFDASYYYNTPVLFGMVIDKERKTATLNFSSFPIFDIAVERICTELY